MDKKYRFLALFGLFLALIFSACSLNQTKQIATFPKESLPHIPNPDGMAVLYRAYIELSVADVDLSADRATSFVYQYGGYILSSQSWQTDDRTATTLVLAVPSTNFENLRRSLLSIGELVNESFSGNLMDHPYPRIIPYSHITLQLLPGNPIVLPYVDSHTWNPQRTFQHAFSVFLTIFGFIADILIWIVVVGGPFLLVFLVVRLIIQRIRPGQEANQESD